MRISLISPAGAMHRCTSGNFKKALRYAPLTLTTLAALVPDELDAEIEIVDEGVQRIPEEIDADLVGITAITGTATRAYRLADELRARGIPVVLGGVHPTIMPDEAKCHADTVVIGYAEETWPQLLHDFAAGRMKPFYRQHEHPSLAGRPFPRRDLLRKNLYLTVNRVQATRGCPNSCDFCVIPPAWGRRQLFRPIEDVVREIESLDGSSFCFLDPSPTENAAYAKALYRALIPLSKRWFGLATVRTADDPELLDLCARSGCRGLLLGFESLSQRGLDGITKSFNSPSRYLDVVRKLHDRGIAIQGCFVLGLDGDDASVFERTVEFVDRAKIDLPRYSVYTPFPKTASFTRLKAEGRILTEDWALYDSQHVVFRPRLMSPEELEQGLHWTWRQTYRVRSIVTRLLSSRCAPVVCALTNVGYRIYADRLPTFTPDVVSEPVAGPLPRRASA